MLLSICTRTGFYTCILSLCFWTPVALSKNKTPHNQTIQLYANIVNSVLENSPELYAAQAVVDAAKAKLTGAGLPINNPELEMASERTDVNTYSIGISQTLDWSDKQGAFEQVARAELTSAQMQQKGLHLIKASELLQAIGMIITNKEIADFSERRTEILTRFTKLAKLRNAAGDIAQVELELANLSLAESIIQQAASSSEFTMAKSQYFAISGKNLNADLKLPEDLPVILDTQQNDEALVQKHPEVQAGQQQALASRLQIFASEQERKADPTIGITAGRDANENLLGLSLSIPINLRNDFKSRVDVTKAQALQAEHEALQSYRNLLAEMKGARESYHLIAKAWKYWKTQGNVSLNKRAKLLESQWHAGEISTTDYLLQVQQTLNTQIAGVELHGKLWVSWINWLSASGTLEQWLNGKAQEISL